jgi:flagellar basal-body rod modification protein FlgD
MTAPISGTPPVTSPTVVPTTSMDRQDQLGKDTFLKLLVAQLKYQDPSNPASNTEFMAQTAQFSQVEKMEQLLAQNNSMLTSQTALTAGAMVGKYVTYTAEDGSSKSGTVSSVRFDPGGNTLIVDGAEVPMGRLTNISEAPADEPTP